MSAPVLVLPPELGFAAMREMLEEAGWLLGAESQEAPLLAGEPHWCEWWHRAGDATIAYTFDPVVRLRLMEFAGSHAAVARAAVGDVVPELGAERVRELIAQEGAGEEIERAVLLGLMAARELGPTMIGAAEAVRARLDDARPRVAALAAEAAAAIVPEEMVAAVRAIAEAGRARPGASIGFAAAGPPEHKRQILRWLAKDFDGSSPPIDQVLRTALIDPDPEVRVTACIVAARLGAVGVVDAMREAVLPETTADGADPRERRLYVLLRDAAVQALALSGQRTAWPMPVRGVMGELPITDDMTLLVHALVTPVERGGEGDTRAWRKDVGGKVAVRVGAVAHWIGHGGEVPPPNRLRQATGGFWILARPWPEWRGTLGEAEALARRASEELGAEVRVPTAEEWEMALRGPDGRLYPWGNNLAATSRGLPSPWGAVPPAGPEWAIDAGGGAVIVGAARPQPCAFRRRPEPDERAGVRFVIGRLEL